MARRKIALIIGYGQSVEGGTGVAPRLAGTAILNADVANNVRHSSIFGAPRQSLTTLAPYVSPCSIFDKLAESLALYTGLHFQVYNKAVGGTAATDSWCGWDAANGRIKAQGESGYDPGGLIAALVAAVTNAVASGYEVWMVTAGHQQDISLGRPVSQIIAASVHIQQRAIAAGAKKVFVGKTARYVGGGTESEWNPGGKIHQIASGVLSGVPGSLVGGDLSANTDINLRATDNVQYIHLNHAGVCWASGVWLDAMISARVV